MNRYIVLVALLIATSFAQAQSYPKATDVSGIKTGMTFAEANALALANGYKLSEKKDFKKTEITPMHTANAFYIKGNPIFINSSQYEYSLQLNFSPFSDRVRQILVVQKPTAISSGEGAWKALIEKYGEPTNKQSLGGSPILWSSKASGTPDTSQSQRCIARSAREFDFPINQGCGVSIRADLRINSNGSLFFLEIALQDYQIDWDDAVKDNQLRVKEAEDEQNKIKNSKKTVNF